MPEIKIDDVAYDIESLSAEAKAQLRNLRVCDAKIQQLRIEIGLLQTARKVFADTLKSQLPKE
ncbi:MAG: hypothetical protein HGB00_03660 [Chlorobiaceae bacterium]|nr:hypothetical protein [Chlorobiaceae bacterium]